MKRFGRAFVGYCTSAADALLTQTEREKAAAKEQRASRLAELARQVEREQDGVRQLETQVASEQRQQQALVEALDVLADQGQTQVQAVREQLDRQEFAIVGAVTQKEAHLGEYRAAIANAKARVQGAIDQLRQDLLSLTGGQHWTEPRGVSLDHQAVPMRKMDVGERPREPNRTVADGLR